MKIVGQDFSEIAFAPGPGGKQQKVVLEVYAGKYDIGTIREGTLNVVADKVDINRNQGNCQHPLVSRRGVCCPGEFPT